MNRRTLALAIGAGLGLFALWFMFLWGPQGGRLHDADVRITTAEQENGTLELRLARLRAAQEQAPQLMANLEELRRAVPDDPQLAEFILDANEIATDTGVDFLSISPGVPSRSDPALPPSVLLSIDVRGGYFEVLDYLDHLAEMPRIVVIDTLGLHPEGDTSGSSGDGLSVALTARMFSTTAPQVGVVDPTATTVPGATATGVTVTTTPPASAPTAEVANG